MDSGSPDPADRTRRRRGPRRATPRSLENAAAYYLRRFATSRAHLRRVLMRRVERSARVHGTDRGEGARAIEEILGKFERLGFLDDAAYAEMRVRALRRRGASIRLIAVQLRQKGLDSDTIDAALAAADGDAETPELDAAATLARKRRLGPYRPQAARKENRERDLATLARAGFSYDTALAVVDAETAAELEGDGSR